MMRLAYLEGTICAVVVHCRYWLGLMTKIKRGWRTDERETHCEVRIRIGSGGAGTPLETGREGVIRCLQV
jgi:hypothetical protein